MELIVYTEIAVLAENGDFSLSIKPIKEGLVFLKKGEGSQSVIVFEDSGEKQFYAYSYPGDGEPVCRLLS